MIQNSKLKSISRCHATTTEYRENQEKWQKIVKTRCIDLILLIRRI